MKAGNMHSHRKSVTLLLIVGLLNCLTLFSQDSSGTSSDAPDEEALIMDGEGLSIVASREENQQIRRVTKEEIVQSQALDIPTLLERLLNLNTTRNGGYGSLSGVSLRGFSGGRVAILIDGIPVNSSQSGSFDLGSIDINAIEGIEVIYGGSDTKYNVDGAVGGVINIITIGKWKPGFSAGGGFSNLSGYPGAYYSGNARNFSAWTDLVDTQNVNFNLSAGNEKVYWTLNLSGNRAANNFLYEDDNLITRRRTNAEVLDATGSSALQILLPGTMKLMFSGEAYFGEKNIAGRTGSLASGVQADIFTKETVFFDADELAEGNLDIELTLSHAFNSLDWKDAIGDSLHEMNAFTVISRWNWYVDDWLTLNAGGDLKASLLASTDIGNMSGYEGGLYLVAKLTAGSDFEFIPSVKAIWTENKIIPIPKLGIAYHTTDGFSIKNNYYRTFKLPTFNDRYWPADSYAEGNPDLRAEDGIGGDLIVEKRFEELLSFENSLHCTYYRDAILWQPSGGKWRPENIGSAFYLGADVTLKSEFSETLGLTAAYSFLLTYALTGEFGFGDDKRMPYSPMHTFGLGIDFRWKGASLSLWQHFESERFSTILNVTRLPPFFTMDIIYNQRINGFSSLFMTIKNIFNEAYYSVEGYPVPGGSITAGIKVNYDSQ